MTDWERGGGASNGTKRQRSIDDVSSHSPRSRLRLIRLCMRASAKAAIGGVAVGFFVLVGYALDWSPAWRPVVGGPATHPMTAAALLVIGLTVLGVRPWRRSYLGIGFTAVVGALFIVELVGLLLGQGDIYRTLMPFQHVMAEEAGAGRAIEMSVNAAATLVLLSASLVCLYARRTAGSQVFAGLAMFLPVAALIGYLYGIPEFYGAMAPWTVAGALLLAVATLLRAAHRAPVRSLLNIGATSRLPRFLVVALICHSVLLGLLAVWPVIDPSLKALPAMIVFTLTTIVAIMAAAASHAEGKTRRRQTQGALRKQTIVSDLDGAAERGEMFLLYQPQIDLATQHMVGVEVLLRWRHPRRGLVSPDEFIPEAEATGLIVPLGAWVLEGACEQAVQWRNGLLADATISVNASVVQINEAGFADKVLRVLRAKGLPPHRLVLEVTESIMAQRDGRGIQALRDLHDAKVRIAIDDFGTGYSSLSYLRLLPSDCLKIDRSFVQGLPGDMGAAAIARAIVALGRSLDMRIVAEGIETKAQAEFLQDIWCDEGQGYLYAPPLTSDALVAWLETRPHSERETEVFGVVL
ncbi:putative bifunctional diguanylate cyclase/phosphodiesterase [Variovorax ginsengisoli]|uniref:EAL domain-containing protein (Putative c-di-GMP-specific phosphodiesterase class I) n=1 Tax=Variovorax ginsengisoli TaxID=363844 RepID=A0ABT9SGH3_9BURK|nr:EAL domain-containing protein [Variovorax ginsengisoli]MDP9902482.1 EAL domain-containing protein (putative c-di-GMP-specific phosphodiesterase class I) [Variovorax ginsengisoli]